MVVRKLCAGEPAEHAELPSRQHRIPGSRRPSAHTGRRRPDHGADARRLGCCGLARTSTARASSVGFDCWSSRWRTCRLPQRRRGGNPDSIAVLCTAIMAPRIRDSGRGAATEFGWVRGVHRVSSGSISGHSQRTSVGLCIRIQSCSRRGLAGEPRSVVSSTGFTGGGSPFLKVQWNPARWKRLRWCGAGVGAARGRSAQLPRSALRGRLAGHGDNGGPGWKGDVVLWPFEPPHAIVRVVQSGQQDCLAAPFPADLNPYELFPHPLAHRCTWLG